MQLCPIKLIFRSDAQNDFLLMWETVRWQDVKGVEADHQSVYVCVISEKNLLQEIKAFIQLLLSKDMSQRPLPSISPLSQQVSCLQ